MDLPPEWSSRNIEDCLINVREIQVSLVNYTESFLERFKGNEQLMVEKSDKLWPNLSRPVRPTEVSQQANRYANGVMNGEIVDMELPDIVMIRDLAPNKVFVVCAFQ